MDDTSAEAGCHQCSTAGTCHSGTAIVTVEGGYHIRVKENERAWEPSAPHGVEVTRRSPSTVHAWRHSRRTDGLRMFGRDVVRNAEMEGDK